MSIASDAQKLVPGALVSLFDIDMTNLNGGILRYAPGALENKAIRWRGNTYISLPIAADGFEVAGRGQLPTPTLTIAKDTLIAAAVITFDDLRGAKVIRWRTFFQYLDGEPGADPNAHFAPDIFKIDRKTKQNKAMIQWELSADIDQQGKMIPGRVFTRGHCSWIYRFAVGNGSFSYSQSPHACPYTGNRYFETSGNPTSDPSKDHCGKRLSDCQKRFSPNPLPYGGAPGIQLSR